MFGYIYKTTNLVNNRIYIGQKKGIFNANYYGSGKILQQAINKYGKNKFKLNIIVYAENKNKLNTLEKKYIKKYRENIGSDILYNISDGGFGGRGRGWKDSIQTKEKKKIAQNSIEVKNKKHLAMLGKKKSIEHKEKIRLSLLGKKHTRERIEKNILSHLGRKVSFKTRMKISNTMTGVRKTIEHRKHMCKKRGPYNVK